MDANLIQILEDTATMLELAGENPFKARAYSSAAHILEEQQIDVFKSVKENTLRNVAGIGAGLREGITEYVHTGKFAEYERLLKEIPSGVLDMTRLRGLGAKKVRSLHIQLGVSSISELEQACRKDKLCDIKGFGKKSQETILKAIEMWRSSQGNFHQHKALMDAEAIVSFLKEQKGFKAAEIAGDLRRRAETVSELYIIAEGKSKEAGEVLKDQFELTEKNGILEGGHSPVFGIPFVVEITDRKNYVQRLHETTGSEEFLIAFRKQFGEDFLKKPFKNEEELYEFLKIPYIEPELRESADIIKLALQNKLPELIEPKHMRGMLHCHSTWSDGHNSIREMALGAKALGYEYFAICDHSRTASYAGGLTIERVKAQHEEVDKLNDEDLGIRILKGIESDILPDGDLDYPDAILKTFDIVVASVHSSFTQTRESQTARIIKALENPYTTILGHATGRILLSRAGFDVDIEAIIDTAAEFGKIIEINANPYRFDLSWQNAKYAKERGVRIAINPDAHAVAELELTNLGIGIARKAGLEKSDIVNTLSCDEFLKLVKK
ncbi:MAG TPA: DNA polymerase/3'-5' exonuclease PolX [Patescibacteria group bacterium]|nr:DNA polymerase/3'-5' exonuclease PolX [Patescibacteria group bacterium]